MGVVYVAEDTRRPDKAVAVKVLLGSEPDLDRRFLRECRILERLSHPNVVAYHDGGVHEGQRYLAMELLAGRTLSSFIGAPAPQIASIFVRICEGLRYLSGKGIIHRDLSLNNVFVAESAGQLIPKILDFGIAKDVEERGSLYELTETGAVLGKLDYMAPEQLKGQKGGMDWRTDLFALGIMLYRCLSGRFPFRGDTPMAVISAHLYEPPDPLSLADETAPVPVRLGQLVFRLLEKQIERRPASYDEVIEVLASSGANQSVEATATPVAETIVEGTAGSRLTERATTETRLLARQARPSVWVAGLTAGAFAVAGAGWWLLRPRSPLPAEVRRSPVAAEAPPGPQAPIAQTAPRASGLASAAAHDGNVAINAIPWARLGGLTNLDTSAPVSLEAGLTTPSLLSLPEGRYRLMLTCGSSGERRDLDFSVASDTLTTRTVVFGDERNIERYLR